MNVSDVSRSRTLALRRVPSGVGVYVLCDLDKVPIYLGWSFISLRRQIERHLMEGRGEAFATYMIDPWEVAYVEAWEVEDERQVRRLVPYIWQRIGANKGVIVRRPIPSAKPLRFALPEGIEVQLLEEGTLRARRDPTLRMPRQVQHFGQLLQYALNAGFTAKLKPGLDLQFNRLASYYRDYITDA